MTTRRPRVFAFFLTGVFILPIICLLLIYLEVQPYLPFKKYLLGIDRPLTIIVLLQNDNEMRTNGGFAGSYAKLVVSSSCHPRECGDPAPKIIIPTINLAFQDIYVPNGQAFLLGHVTPPSPIQQAFQHGTWELANADWEPDFPTASTSLRWFFEKGGEANPDLLITLPLSTVKKVFDIVGSIPLPQYEAQLTSENLWLFLQGKIEVGFFPGSTQKRDILTAVGSVFKDKLFHLNPIQYYQIYQTIKQDIKNENIVINSRDENFQKLLISQNYAGVFRPISQDTYALIETNLGANKANCCVRRLTTHQITFDRATYRHDIELTLTNESPETTPNPPLTYGGHYNAYLRFYLPIDAWGITLSRQETTPSASLFATTEFPQIKTNFGFQEIGFFQTTSIGTTSRVQLSYFVATESAANPYQLTILKQHGMRSSPQTINLFGYKFSSPLNHTEKYP